jgi:hypothetical protein
MLYCYGHLDNSGTGTFVSPERKNNYTVKACGMFLEHPQRSATATPQISAVPPEILRKPRIGGKHRIQTQIEGF